MHVAAMWNLYAELRKELVEAQKVRAQIFGVKITFITTGIAIIWAGGNGKFPGYLLVAPAVASVFFDCMIASYSFSIKRIGYYLRTYLEPRLRVGQEWPPGVPYWEEFMCSAEARQAMTLVGNLGLTTLAMIAAAVGLFTPYDPVVSVPLLVLLVVIAVLDYLLSVRPYHRFDGRPPDLAAPGPAAGVAPGSPPGA